MGWRIEFSRSAERELAALDAKAARRIIRFLRERVLTADHPRMAGEPLHGPDLGRFWKYRVGAYRVIASIEDAVVTIHVVRVGHRSQVYRDR
ncbi:MAG TPA: type II toxin-antitoxin system mRNA interferase toxin, RelE/StbE family [Xanthomonadales bacterium]|nr:type II toxin-antitoxin system mRNA interferase toxin, RelE/StbE family [Xanthomonadales bacterium]